MNSIIIIEGPNCVGKTSLADYLVRELDIPLYYNISNPKVWESPRDGYIEFLTLHSMGRYENIEFICDRGLLSFMYYNETWRKEDIILNWYQNLLEWSYSKIICMMSSYENIMKNAINKSKGYGLVEELEEEELKWFSNAYENIPDELKIDCFIENYNDLWKEKIVRNLLR